MAGSKMILDTINNIFSNREALMKQTGLLDTVEKVKSTAYPIINKANDELLETKAKKEAEEGIKILQKIYGLQKNGVEKLDLFIEELISYEYGRKLEKGPTTNSSEEFIIDQKIIQKFLSQAQPYLQQIITQGIGEGHFNIKYPNQLNNHYIVLITHFNEIITNILLDIKNHNLEDVKAELDFYQNTFERLFGIQEGKITFANKIYNFAKSQFQA